MGAGFYKVDWVLSHLGVPNARGLKVLDIGCQNLYVAQQPALVAFIRKWNDVYADEKLEEYAHLVSAGAAIDATIGGLNGAWLGDLLSRAGFDYVAYDIFEGYRTVLFDLNVDSVRPKEQGCCDVVFNFGTTEHVLNQLNCFRVIHDAAAIGALMYHDLPLTGYLNHGYFNYQPRLFVDLAAANNYELLSIQYGKPEGSDDLVDRLINPYEGQPFMHARDFEVTAWRQSPVPMGGLSVLVRKTSDDPFRNPLEVSTTAGTVARSVQSSYQKDESNVALTARVASEASQVIGERCRHMLARIDTKDLRLGEIMQLYQDFRAALPGEPFPLQLEKRALELGLELEPNRDDLIARLEVVERDLLRAFPLLAAKLVQASAVEGTAAMDGVERAIREIEDRALRVTAIGNAYRQYHSAGRIKDFPPDLELEAINDSCERFPGDSTLKVRLGKLLSQLTTSFALSNSDSQ